MKILIATGLYPPEIGGPATYVTMLEALLPQHGFTLDVLPFNSVRRYPKIIKHLAFAWKIWRRSKDCDVVYALDPVSVGLPAMIAAKARNKTFLLRVPGDFAWEQGQLRFGVTDSFHDFINKRMSYGWRVSLLCRVESFVSKQATRVIVPSDYMKGAVVKWGLTPERVTRIYSAVSPVNVPLSKAEARADLQYSGLLIVSAGRLVPNKGYPSLIKAFAQVKTEHPEAHLVIVGDGPEYTTLEDLVRKTGLTNAVTFKGRMERADLAKEIRAADMFVLNTAHEGLSHLLVEVMNIGTPIITTPVGGNVELISGEVNGLLVPYNDVNTLSQAMMRLATDPALNSKLVTEARSKLSNFEASSAVKQLSGLLRTLKPEQEGLRVLSIGYGRHLFDRDNFEYQRLDRCATEVNLSDSIIFSLQSVRLQTHTSENGFTLHPTNSKHKVLMLFDAIRLGSKLVKKKHINTVSTQDVFETGLVGLVLKWRHPRLILQVQEHGDVLSSKHWRQEKLTNQLRYWFARYLLKKADVVRVVSARTESYLRPLLKPSTTLHKLPVVIDTASFTGHTAERKGPSNPFWFVTAARFVPQKNFSLMLQAFASAHKETPHIRLRIFGDGPQKNKIVQLIKKLELESVVEMHGWSKDLATEMLRADAYLLTSNYEGWARVLIEAMMLRLPIVTTDVGCVHEVVKHGEHGLVVPVDNPVELTEAIKKLATDTALYIEIVSNLSQLDSTNLPGTDIREYAKKWAHTLR